MVSFSKSIAVIASLTTIAIAAVTAVRYFDSMDSRMKDQQLLIEKLQKELTGGGNSSQERNSQAPSNPILPSPASSPAEDLPPSPAPEAEKMSPLPPTQ